MKGNIFIFFYIESLQKLRYSEAAERMDVEMEEESPATPAAAPPAPLSSTAQASVSPAQVLWNGKFFKVIMRSISGHVLPTSRGHWAKGYGWLWCGRYSVRLSTPPGLPNCINWSRYWAFLAHRWSWTSLSIGQGWKHKRAGLSRFTALSLEDRSTPV